jgi:hypothetical protein
MAGKKGRSGRRKGSLSWSKTPAALAGHHLNGLIEMWLAGVPIPTRPDWWLVQPTGRRHTVPPEIKRALAQAAIEYVVWLDAKAIEQGRRHGPPIQRPNTDQVLAWSRRLAPAVTLRHKANSAARTPAQRAWEERLVRLENGWKTRCYGLRPFLFSRRRTRRISPADFLLIADFLAHGCKPSARDRSSGASADNGRQEGPAAAAERAPL